MLSVVPVQHFVRADVPTAVQYTVNPSMFAEGSSATTQICMKNETSPSLTFNTNDLSIMILDGAMGTVSSVDTPITVNSSSLLPADFSVTLTGAPTPKIRLTYTNGSSKPFNFGDSICVTLHFTAAVTPGATFVRFANNFTGLSGLLPSTLISVVDPAILPAISLGSSNQLPGTAPGTIFVSRNTGSNPGQPFTLQGGSPAVGATDIAGGDLVMASGEGTGLGGGGNVRIQTAGANDLTGTSDNLLVDREIFVGKAKQLTLAAPGFTSLMSIHLVGTHTAGGRIFYNIRATDGGSQIATETGVIQYTATANSITCTVQTTDKLHLGTVNSGCTPGFFNPGSQPGVSIFDNVSFSSPAPIVVHEVYFRITNESGSAIRLEP